MRSPDSSRSGSPRAGLVEEGVPDVLPLSGQEGEGHAAADDQGVHLGGQQP